MSGITNLQEALGVTPLSPPEGEAGATPLQPDATEALRASSAALRGIRGLPTVAPVDGAGPAGSAPAQPTDPAPIATTANKAGRAVRKKIHKPLIFKFSKQHFKKSMELGRNRREWWSSDAAYPTLLIQDIAGLVIDADPRVVKLLPKAELLNRLKEKRLKENSEVSDAYTEIT